MAGGSADLSGERRLRTVADSPPHGARRSTCDRPHRPVWVSNRSVWRQHEPDGEESHNQHDPYDQHPNQRKRPLRRLDSRTQPARDPLELLERQHPLGHQMHDVRPREQQERVFAIGERVKTAVGNASLGRAGSHFEGVALEAIGLPSNLRHETSRACAGRGAPGAERTETEPPRTPWAERKTTALRTALLRSCNCASRSRRTRAARSPRTRATSGASSAARGCRRTPDRCPRQSSRRRRRLLPHFPLGP